MFRGGYILSRFNKLGELRISYIAVFHAKTPDMNEVSGGRRLPGNLTPGRLNRIQAGSIWARQCAA